MKVPHAEGEAGGLTIKQVKETCPGVVKVISLVNLDKKEVFKGGPKMYTREEVYGEGLLLGEVLCKPVGHPDSEPYPSEEVVEQFLKEVDVEGLVAVHCAHGLNRTGYLICRYLIQKCGVEPREAVARFNEARGFPMRREILLQHLYNRSWEKNGGIEQVRQDGKEDNSDEAMRQEERSE